MLRCFGATLLATTGLVVPLRAQDEPPDPVAFTANFGLVNVAGNTRLTTVSVGEGIEVHSGPWVAQQAFDVVYGETDGVTSTSQWKGNVRGDRVLSPAAAIFLDLRYQRNTFAGITRRFEEVLGFAYTALDTPRDKLSFEAGGSLVQQRSTLDVEDNFAAGLLAGRFRHQFNGEAAFIQTVEFLPNLKETDDYRINSESKLLAPLSGAISLSIAYVVRFDNVPEPTFQKTDRIFTSGLQISL